MDAGNRTAAPEQLQPVVGEWRTGAVPVAISREAASACGAACGGPG